MMSQISPPDGVEVHGGHGVEMACVKGASAQHMELIEMEMMEGKEWKKKP
jgi:hypothetical protein